METALISSFCSVKQTRVLDSPGRELTHRRLAPSKCCYSFAYPGRKENWVRLGRKEGRTNVQISEEPRIELGTLWTEGRDLTNCTNHSRPDNLTRVDVTRPAEMKTSKNILAPSFYRNSLEEEYSLCHRVCPSVSNTISKFGSVREIRCVQDHSGPIRYNNETHER